MKNQAQELVNIFGRLFCDLKSQKLYLRSLFGEKALNECDSFNAHEYLNGLRSLTLEQQEMAHEIVELATEEVPV